jgi:hypothetical protein
MNGHEEDYTIRAALSKRVPRKFAREGLILPAAELMPCYYFQTGSAGQRSKPEQVAFPFPSHHPGNSE